MTLDLIPMLLLSLLLMTVGGDVSSVQLVLGGIHEASEGGGLVVADGALTVPAGASVAGPVHVLGGNARIEGRIDGDVTLLAGSLLVEEGAEVAGALQHIGGGLTVEPGARIASRTTLGAVPADRGLAARLVPFGLVTGLLALVAARRARRRPASLEHLRNALQHHPVVSLTVGALVSISFLSLFVFMAFTLVLLPVSVLGLATGLVLVGYGVVALGAVVAQRLPLRPDAAAAAGTIAVLAVLWAGGQVPVVGSLVVGLLLLSGLGAVLVTYIGLKEFQPVHIPERAAQ